jgi:hypothetical protein
MSAYAQETAAGAFARSGELFASVVTELGSAETAQVTHGELEDLLTERSRELMRTMMQDHLDLRAAREQRRGQVPGARGWYAPGQRRATSGGWPRYSER